MFGGMEEMQKQMQEKLTAIVVEAEAGDGLVKIKANAAREILDVSINADLSDKEEVEDLVLVAVNKVLALAAEKEQAEMQGMLGNMLPGGMGGLGDLLGGM